MRAVAPAIALGVCLPTLDRVLPFTVAALELSSSQHSPRLLQTFVRDRVLQSTLAVLVGTFVYA